MYMYIYPSAAAVKHNSELLALSILADIYCYSTSHSDAVFFYSTALVQWLQLQVTSRIGDSRRDKLIKCHCCQL